MQACAAADGNRRGTIRMELLRGTVASVQRCSVHDGPGIRTTIFMKGCPLHCAWCHNPETIRFEPETVYHPERCIHCGHCDEGCFSGARVLCGERMSVSEAVGVALMDKAYYGKDGGVTISGGEPTAQSRFVSALLKELRAQGVHTAVETCLFGAWEALASVVRECDLVMADLKLWDSEKHRCYTGAGNETILRNLSRVNRPLIVRTPVVGGVNDEDGEIAAIAAFVGKLPTLLYYELLPYHPLGLSKGQFEQQRFVTPDGNRMRELAGIARRECPNVRIAGRIVT